jgi:polyisoprenoid-binding protein YceI
MKKLYTLLLATTLVTPAFAQAEVQQWAIDNAPEKSHINFEGTQMGAPFKGNFKEFSGNIIFDATKLEESKAEINIPLSSVEANSVDRNNYIKTADWFNTAEFPDAKFITKAITKGEGDNSYIADGELTMRGVTLPVKLPFTLKEEGSTATMEGQTTLNRIEYGIGANWNDPNTVGLDVKLDIKITAEKKQQVD